MVRRQIAARGVRAPRVLAAMVRVPRHRFVPHSLARMAYDDGPLPVGSGQTISQPFIVALMTEALGLARAARVLEVGTGSGYQTAILAELVREVHTIERLPDLAAAARETLDALGYGSIRFKLGDGSLGWPDEAPFDAILVTAAAPDVPSALLGQLAEGGRLVAPVGDPAEQELVVLTRGEGRFAAQRLGPVRFVPLVGAQGFGNFESPRDVG